MRGARISKETSVVGIDVGGERKGFHAVALRNGIFCKATSRRPAEIVDWCVSRNAEIVAVDAPCGWSKSTSSRAAEREMKLGEERIHCFATPTRLEALAHKKRFYDWVFNGEKLYRELVRKYKLFDGKGRRGPICFETFPHAIVCALSGRVVPTKPKVQSRRRTLRELGYDPASLPNIDFLDAALCAIAADAFREGRSEHFGRRNEGFIVIPASKSSAEGDCQPGTSPAHPWRT